MQAFTRASIAILATIMACLGTASAQPADFGCTSAPSPAQTRTLTCQGGVTIIVENEAQFTLLDRDRNGRVDGISLLSKAVFVSAPKQKSGRQFQVITPQAIAAVRGTEWAVDAEGTKTSVFVQTGRVGVRRVAAGRGVVLGPGEGVDVDATTTPLQVRQWGAPRIAALMARLGR